LPSCSNSWTFFNLGGNVLVFSSLHTTGEQLTQLTGIAAILHFGLPDLETEVEEEQEKKRVGNLVRDGDVDAEEDLDAEL
jgi:protein pelota